MVISGATAFRSRSSMLRNRMAPVTSMAFRGSPDFVRCSSHSPPGSTRCSPIAIRIRPEPTSEASAEEKVAPSSPATTGGPQ